jgi:hypothetical protein
VEDVEEGEEYLNIQMTFTREAGVSLIADHWTIDGCGYLDVYIHLVNVHDLYALDVALTFDPDVLEVVDLLSGEENPGVNLLPINTWFKSDYIVYNNAYNQAEGDNEAGTIRYVATQKRDATPVSGAGDVAKIRFRAKAVADDTPLTITKAEFSDRDGFLVGRPAGYEVPAATITTQFTAAGGLDLDIIRKDASTVQLQWPKPGEDSGIKDYTLHKSKLPYFELGDTEVEKITTGFDVTDDLITFDDAVLGNVVDNWFYALQVACEHDYESPLSWQVGKFEYRLYERADDTDFTWIGLVLDTDEIAFASDLATHIEANCNSEDVNVTTVSEWHPLGQGIGNLFDPDDPIGTEDFGVGLRFPYRIEIDLPGFDENTIWAQVGKLLPKELKTYTLYEGVDDTDFTWILQPLDMTEINSVEDLAYHIQSNSTPVVVVKTISKWDPVGQGFIPFQWDDPNSIFETRFGYPYRVEVEVETGNTAIWP